MRAEAKPCAGPPTLHAASLPPVWSGGTVVVATPSSADCVALTAHKSTRMRIIRLRMGKKKKSSWTDTSSGRLPEPALLSEQYFYVTQRPWPSLLFILPMLLAFEIGSYVHHDPAGGSSQLVATYLIDVMINSFGRSAFYLPGLLAIVILLTTHIAGRHPWKFDVYVLAGMLGESLIWTVPLFVFDRVVVVHTALRAGVTTRQNEWINEVLRSLGAGFYDELVFRLICITAI